MNIRARFDVWRHRADLFERSGGWRDVESALIVLAVGTVWAVLVLKICAALFGPAR